MNSLSVNRLLQKLAITVTHPFRRIRSFEDCLAERDEFEPSVPIVRSLNKRFNPPLYHGYVGLETLMIARIASRRRGAAAYRCGAACIIAGCSSRPNPSANLVR